MNLFKRMLITAPAAIAMAAFVGAYALDLPTKKVNGKSCYYYTVKKSETVYGIANKLGISRDDIITYNPAAADGIKEGQTLYFPVGEFKGLSESSEDDATVTHTVAKGETLYGISHNYGVTTDELIALNPSAKSGVKAGQVLIISKGEQAQEANIGLEIPECDDSQMEHSLKPVDKGPVIEISANDSVANYAPRKYTVAVMLPFMLDEDKTSKATNQVTDFYRGFLIAADSIVTPNQQIDVLAYDTKGSLEQVKSILSTDARIKEANIIVAPSNQEQLQAIAEFGKTYETYVLNNFVVKDSSYQTNPYVLQTNITTDKMYEMAVDAFVDAICNDGMTTPVIINNTTGKQDKQAFIDMLTKQLIAKGIAPLTIQYTGNLAASTITEQLGDPLPGQSYAFISTSASLTDFNKYSPGILKFKETINSNGGNVRLFGYPEWTTFKKDALEMLHKVDATIYSRFYADSNSRDMRGIESAFKRWYGKSPADGVPSQAALGFDTGCYIFNALNINEGDFSNSTSCSWQGAQTTFDFKHDNNSSGQVNETVYIVRYQPGSYTDTIVL